MKLGAFWIGARSIFDFTGIRTANRLRPRHVEARDTFTCTVRCPSCSLVFTSTAETAELAEERVFSRLDDHRGRHRRRTA